MACNKDNIRDNTVAELTCVSQLVKNKVTFFRYLNRLVFDLYHAR
jgi:hypothetical protein